MSGISVNQQQKHSQLQSMRLTQHQIFALKLLAMGAMELRSEIYKQAEDNPALEITSDPLLDESEVTEKTMLQDSVRLGAVSSSGESDSDAFQNFIENSPDSRETLQLHLECQLNLLKLSSAERELCLALINNLDSNGYHILAPITLVSGKNLSEEEKNALLEKCLNIVQHFDPAGICCSNVQESLELQASFRSDTPFLARFILHGHLEFINPPITARIHKKLLNWISDRKSLAFVENTEGFPEITRKDISDSKIEESVNFIRSLNPYPAREFGVSESASYARADVFVTHCKGRTDSDDFEAGIVLDTDDLYFKITFDQNLLPKLRLAPAFLKSGDDEFVKNQTCAAKDFISSVVYRESSLVKICSVLVKVQIDFFRNGIGHLAPLTQKKLASLAGVHESTVSRMADDKFIRCEWGVFPIKYFFSTAVSLRIPASEKILKNYSADKKTSENAADSKAKENMEAEIKTEVSSDTVRLEILKILNNSPPEQKRLSDQKIADILTERGYKIARRTVAKYRKQLNIESSYERS